MTHDPRFTNNESRVEESPHKGKTGLKRVWTAFFYSMAGLRAAFRHADAFRQELHAPGHP